MKPLADILPALGVTPPDGEVPRPVPLCVGGCGVEVPRRGAWCPACGRKDRAAVRLADLQPAYATLPDWPWARFDNEKFCAHVRKTGGDVMLRTANEWRRKDGHLTLVGATGAGKTAVVAAIAHRILDMARDDDALHAHAVEVAAALRFVAAVDLGDAAKRWPPRDQQHPPLVQAALDASILILDDLGHEDPKERVVFKVIDARYRSHGKPTIVTSRLARADMEREDRYGPDGARRIYDCTRVVDLFRQGGGK